MNIKSEEAHRLARAVAARTGETVTEAVTVALRERLERLEAETITPEERFQRLRAITLRSAPLMVNFPSPEEIDDFLYDERGLPK